MAYRNRLFSLGLYGKELPVCISIYLSKEPFSVMESDISPCCLAQGGR